MLLSLRPLPFHSTSSSRRDLLAIFFRASIRFGNVPIALRPLLKTVPDYDVHLGRCRFDLSTATVAPSRSTRPCLRILRPSLRSRPKKAQSPRHSDCSSVSPLPLIEGMPCADRSQQAQLLQPSFLNGNPGQESVWTALDRLVPPDLVSPRAPALHPFLSLNSADRARDSTEPVDDGAICVSFPFCGGDGERSSESVLRGIEIVPYTVELVKVSVRSESAPSARAGVAAGKIEKWWNLEWLKKSEVKEAARDRVVVAKKVSGALVTLCTSSK